jgi:hypothetical protein
MQISIEEKIEFFRDQEEILLKSPLKDFARVSFSRPSIKNSTVFVAVIPHCWGSFRNFGIHYNLGFTANFNCFFALAAESPLKKEFKSAFNDEVRTIVEKTYYPCLDGVAINAKGWGKVFKIDLGNHGEPAEEWLEIYNQLEPVTQAIGEVIEKYKEIDAFS